MGVIRAPACCGPGLTEGKDRGSGPPPRGGGGYTRMQAGTAGYREHEILRTWMKKASAKEYAASV